MVLRNHHFDGHTVAAVIGVMMFIAIALFVELVVVPIKCFGSEVDLNITTMPDWRRILPGAGPPTACIFNW